MKMLCFFIGEFFLRCAVSRTLSLILTLTVFGSSHFTFASNQEPSPSQNTSLLNVPKHVLVLFSYHRAEWSDNVQKGIDSVFTPYQSVNFFYEYMDTKRLKTKAYLDTLRKIYTEKYANAHIDVIICVDNNALDLLTENARTLLPDTPVVFCGINDYKPALHVARPNVTGVVEYGDFSDTLKIAFRARPNATKLYIVCDHTETGEINTQDLLAALSLIKPNIQTVLTDRMSYEDLSTTLQTADPQQVAFFVSFWKDGAGRNIEPRQLDPVFRKSAIPVFGRSEWMINHGMVGGKCVTGFAQGEAAARIALQILGGTPVSSLPVDTNSPNQYLFDHLMMKHYLIDEGIFPDESISFNRPEPFYRVSKPIGATILAFSTLLLATLVFLVVNIHRRKQAEDATLKSNKLLQTIINTAPVRIFFKDKELRYIGCNNVFAMDAGVKCPENLIGKDDYQLAWKEQAELYRADDLRVIESGILKLSYDEPQTTPEGNQIWLRTSKVPLRNESNEIIGVLGMYEDITEHKKAETDKTRLLLRQRAILDNLPMMAWLKDTESRLEMINEPYAKACGHTIDECIGKTDLDLFPEEMAKGYIANDREVCASGQKKHMEEKISSPDGIRWHHTYKTPIYDENGVIIGTAGIAQDITDRKQAEEERGRLQEQLIQAQKMESVGHLAGGVAHEFNNMLGVILGHAEMAMDQIDPAGPLYGDLEQIRRAAGRSADITRQLLAFARKQNIAPKVLDLNETIEIQLKMLRRLIGENIDLLWKPVSSLWTIKADPSQIDQILTNLCVNARDAITGIGRITVKTGNCFLDNTFCETHAGSVSGEYVLMSVSDTGCGIDEQTLDHIFEPFFTTKNVGQGTGLGLAMVYGAVKQNNGFIDVESEPVKGTVFTIYLPRYMETGTTGQETGEGLAAPAEGGRETILLVEDEPSILHMATRMLQSLGYSVLTASTPGEAIRWAEMAGAEIHLLITDVIMPEMNGRDLAERLLTVNNGIKCLFMSGYTSDIIDNQGLLVKGMHFIQKPFSKKELAARIGKILYDPANNATPG